MVEELLELAHNDFKNLPVWFKKQFSLGNISIGKNKLRCESKSFYFDAELGDMLLLCEVEGLVAMSEKDFFRVYESKE